MRTPSETSARAVSIALFVIHQTRNVLDYGVVGHVTFDARRDRPQAGLHSVVALFEPFEIRLGRARDSFQLMKVRFGIVVPDGDHGPDLSLDVLCDLCDGRFDPLDQCFHSLESRFHVLGPDILGLAGVRPGNNRAENPNGKNVMETLHDWYRAAHVWIGIAGLLLFWIPAFTTKGGKIHRTAGRLFVWSVYFVAGSALISCVWAMPRPILSPTILRCHQRSCWGYVISFRSLSYSR